jgi:DNA repair protein RecO (recombination protein O)
MQWSDTGIVLSVRKHGETSAIVSLLTQEHGRHPGLVRGGVGRRKRGILQPGNEVAATWRARLPEQLGSFTIELTAARAAAFLDDQLRLAALSAACAVVETTLPEREAHPMAFAGLMALLAALDKDTWPALYVRWEIDLLSELGFGLDLSRCAATGATEGLSFVSPRTGRAVSREAGEAYASRLLPLPGFLTGAADDPGSWSWGDIRDGLALTGYFLERHVLAPHNMGVPPARLRLAGQIADKATTSGV